MARLRNALGATLCFLGATQAATLSGGLSHNQVSSPSPVVPTTESIYVFDTSGNSRVHGLPLAVGDLIDAYDPGGVRCGTLTVTTAGQFPAMPVYRDDALTELDEGADVGDELRFQVNGELAAVNAGGPVLWTANGDLKDIVLTVLAGGDNTPPVLAPIGPQTATIGAFFSLDLSAADADGDLLTFAVVGAPAGATLTGERFEWTPTADQTGDHLVTFTVSDGRGAQDAVTVTFTVIGGLPPVVPTTESVYVFDTSGNSRVHGLPLAVGDLIDAYDPDGVRCGTLTVTTAGQFPAMPVYRDDALTALDEGADVGDELRFQVNGEPAAVSAGGPVLWTANGDLKDIVLTVPADDNNTSPVLAPIGPQTATVGVFFSLDLSAADADGDPLNFGVQGAPAGASLTVDRFEWTPTADQTGDHQVTFTVADGRGAEDAVTVTFTVRTPAVNLTYGPGWSMMSLPLLPADNTINAMFPDAISAFGFAGGYQQVATIDPCEGYWLNLASGGTYSLTGTLVDQCAQTLPPGWSMVGVPVDGIVVNDIIQNPIGNIISIFGFASGYVHKQGTQLLDMGQGFWFNMGSAGQLTMDSNAGGITPKPLAHARAEGLALPTGRLVVSASGGDERAILLGVSARDITALPPPPPPGVLDVRVELDGVSTDRIPLSDRATQYRLIIQGTGLRLHWRIDDADPYRWELVVGGHVYPLSGRGSMQIDEPRQDMWLRHSALPTQSFLAPNYPNPFNPSTTILYAVASDALMTLRIANLAGQIVRTLVQGHQVAGYHTVTWDSRDDSGRRVAAGLYLYTLETGSDRLVRKMMVLR